MILEKIHPEIKNLPTELFKVMKNRGGKTFVHLTRRVQWRFMNLNSTFNTHVRPTKQTLVIYSDVEESTVLGAQKHPLLRKVQLERLGQGRATVEPIHHEWIKLRSNRLEIIEVQIATPEGPLVVLPTGKTLVTIGDFDEYKRTIPSLFPIIDNNHVRRISYMVSYSLFARKGFFAGISQTSRAYSHSIHWTWASSL